MGRARVGGGDVVDAVRGVAGIIVIVVVVGWADAEGLAGVLGKDDHDLGRGGESGVDAGAGIGLGDLAVVGEDAAGHDDRALGLARARSWAGPGGGGRPNEADGEGEGCGGKDLAHWMVSLVTFAPLWRRVRQS